MCNDYRLKVDLDTIARDFDRIGIRLNHPDGIPNTAARQDIRMTDTAPIVRTAAETGTADLVARRWSWAGPTGKPVFNFKSEGRRFDDNRILIPIDGFYEFTDQVPKAKLSTSGCSR